MDINGFGATYLERNHTPILQELQSIEDHLDQSERLSVFVDDVRLFGLEHGYPEPDTLVAFVTRNGLQWQIGHDIYVATNH